MAQPADNTKLDNRPDAFRQLDEWLPTPTETRLASGAPGPQYWQQNADYKIQITLDDDKQRLEGKETVTYHNRSPHTLRYLWFQLDQNRFDPNSGAILFKELVPTAGADQFAVDDVVGKI
ncbi:MAG: aminopeptidase, partial [Planctomycetota bacterium]